MTATTLTRWRASWHSWRDLMRTRFQRTLAVVLALGFLGGFAATAYANQSVWLDWVPISGYSTDQWAGHYLNYVEAIPNYYNGACANGQINGNEYFNWVCSGPGDGVQSGYMHAQFLYAQAWNINGSQQPVWAWAGYTS